MGIDTLLNIFSREQAPESNQESKSESNSALQDIATRAQQATEIAKNNPELRQKIIAGKQAEAQQAQSNGKQMEIHNPMDKYIIKQSNPNAQSAQASQASQESAVAQSMQASPSYYYKRATGVSYFDKKKDLSILDALMAREMGVDVSKYQRIDMNLNANVDLKQRTASANDATNSLRQLHKTMQSVANHADLISKGQGTMNFLARKLNDGTAGITPLSDINSKIQASEKILPQQITDILYKRAGTEQEREKIANLISFKGKSEKQIKEQLGQVLRMLRDNYIIDMQTLQNNNFPIDEYVKNLEEVDELAKKFGI